MAQQAGLPARFRRKIYLFLDFDGTITSKDTMHLLAQCGYTSSKKNSELLSHGESQADLPPWNYFVDAYLQDFRHHLSRYQPEKEHRTTKDEEIAWLRSLRIVEKASAERVNTAGVFDHVDGNAISQAAATALERGDLVIRPGLHSLLNLVYSWNASVESIRVGSSAWRSDVIQMPGLQIVSVNWSRSWIAAAMENHIQSSDLTNSIVFRASIYSNELPSLDQEWARPQMARWNPVSDSTTIAVKCRTSQDKVEQMKSSLRDITSDSTVQQGKDGSRGLIIYIGDSATDLECLLEADIGICIRDDPMGSGQGELADLCKRVNIPVGHVVDAKPDSGSPDLYRLWWAAGFEEVATWVDVLTAGTATAALQHGIVLEDLQESNKKS